MNEETKFKSVKIDDDAYKILTMVKQRFGINKSFFMSEGVREKFEREFVESNGLIIKKEKKVILDEEFDKTKCL